MLSFHAAARLGRSAQPCIRVAQATLERQNLLDFAVRNELQRLPNLLGNQVLFAIRLDNLDEPLCVGRRIGPANDTVVRQQDRVVLLDKGNHGLGKCLCAGSLIGRHRHRSHKHLVL